MSQQCACCLHPEREDIEAGIVAGRSMRSLGMQYGMSTSSVCRHRDRHLSPALAALAAERKGEDAASLVAQVRVLVERADQLYAAAAKDGKATAALAALKEMRGSLELLGKATGELASQPTVTINLMQSEEWLAVRAALFAALATYPEARQAVAGQLLQLEAGS